MAVPRKLLAFQLRDWVGTAKLIIIDPGRGWPSRFDCEMPSGVIRLAAHLGRITLTKRHRDEVERRFQNPGQDHPVVALEGEYPILLGLAEIANKPVIVGMDAQKRIGTATRQSLFMPKDLLPSGIERGWAEHISTADERIVAFVPPLLPFFVDVYRSQRAVTKAEIRAALKEAGVRPLPPSA